jgi:hypothetical protein
VNIKAVVGKCIKIVVSPKVPLIASPYPHNTTWVVALVPYILQTELLGLAALNRMRSGFGRDIRTVGGVWFITGPWFQCFTLFPFHSIAATTAPLLLAKLLLMRNPVARCKNTHCSFDYLRMFRVSGKW